MDLPDLSPFRLCQLTELLGSGLALRIHFSAVPFCVHQLDFLLFIFFLFSRIERRSGKLVVIVRFLELAGIVS